MKKTTTLPAIVHGHHDVSQKEVATASTTEWPLHTTGVQRTQRMEYRETTAPLQASASLGRRAHRMIIQHYQRGRGRRGHREVTVGRGTAALTGSLRSSTRSGLSPSFLRSLFVSSTERLISFASDMVVFESEILRFCLGSYKHVRF